MTITTETIARLRELLAKAPPRPWQADSRTVVSEYGPAIICHMAQAAISPDERHASATLIAEVVNSLNHLIDAAERGLAIDYDDLSAIRNQRDSAIRDNASAIGELQQWRERAEKAERERDEAVALLREVTAQRDLAQSVAEQYRIEILKTEANERRRAQW